MGSAHTWPGAAGRGPRPSTQAPRLPCRRFQSRQGAGLTVGASLKPQAPPNARTHSPGGPAHLIRQASIVRSSNPHQLTVQGEREAAPAGMHRVQAMCGAQAGRHPRAGPASQGRLCVHPALSAPPRPTLSPLGPARSPGGTGPDPPSGHTGAPFPRSLRRPPPDEATLRAERARHQDHPSPARGRPRYRAGTPGSPAGQGAGPGPEVRPGPGPQRQAQAALRSRGMCGSGAKRPRKRRFGQGPWRRSRRGPDRGHRVWGEGA